MTLRFKCGLLETFILIGLTELPPNHVVWSAENNYHSEIICYEKHFPNTTEQIRKNVTLDWTIKEQARAKLRVLVKRILKKYGYPPDMAALATDTVIEQAERLAEELG